MTESTNIDIIKDVHRGELFYMYYGQAIGSEMQKSRPVVVVSNEDCNKHSPVVTVLPITSKDKQRLPTHVDVPDDMPVYGVIMAEQILTVSKSRLGDYIGELDANTIKKVDEAIATQCGISCKHKSSSTDELAKKNEELDKRSAEIEDLQRQLKAKSVSVCCDEDLRQKYELAASRAKLFEQLYKEEIINAAKR